MGRNGSVAIATRYELDGPGIESRGGGEVFRIRTDRPRAYLASYTVDSGFFPGVNRPGRGVEHPPHLAPRLRKKESYTSTPLSDLRGLF
jgi:hypothetical protein